MVVIKVDTIEFVISGSLIALSSLTSQTLAVFTSQLFLKKWEKFVFTLVQSYKTRGQVFSNKRTMGSSILHSS